MTVDHRPERMRGAPLQIDQSRSIRQPPRPRNQLPNGRYRIWSPLPRERHLRTVPVVTSDTEQAKAAPSLHFHRLKARSDRSTSSHPRERCRRREIQYEGRPLPYSVYDQHPTIPQGEIVENKRLGAVLGMIQAIHVRPASAGRQACGSRRAHPCPRNRIGSRALILLAQFFTAISTRPSSPTRTCTRFSPNGSVSGPGSTKYVTRLKCTVRLRDIVPLVLPACAVSRGHRAPKGGWSQRDR